MFSTESIASNEMAHHQINVCNAFIEEIVPADIPITYAILGDLCKMCNLAISYHARRPSPAFQAHVRAAPSSNINNAIISSLPKFGDDYKTVQPFLQRYEQVLTGGNVDQSQWTRLLLLSVKNVNEASWIKLNIVTANVDWDAAKVLFTRHFESANYQNQLVKLYEFCTQLKTENVQKFSDRFTLLVDQIGYSYEDPLVIQHYTSRLLAERQADYEKQLHLASLTKSGRIAITSLKEVIQLAVDLDNIEMNAQLAKSGKSYVGGFPDSSAASGTKGGLEANSSNNQKTCKFHPNSNTHTSAECSVNPDNSNKSKSTPTGETKAEKLVRRGIICHSCGGPHYANSIDCPNRRSNQVTTRSQAASATVASTTLPTATPATVIQSRSADLEISNMYNELELNNTSVHLASIDRTLPERVILPKTFSVAFLVNGSVFNTLLDTGAGVSFVDESLISEFKFPLLSNPAGGTINMAQNKLKVDRIGQVKIDVLALFPGVDKRTVKFQHSFEILPIYDSSKDYHFIIGVDLIPLIFPAGIPLNFVPSSPAANGQPISLQTLQINLDSNSVSSVSESDIGISALLLNNVNLQELLETAEMTIDNGIGILPPLEEPNRAMLSTSEQLDREYTPHREQLLSTLAADLALNESITGFCNLPESIVTLEIDPALRHKLYRRQYTLAHSLIELADPVIQRWYDTGKICLAPPHCEFNNPICIAPKKDENGKMTGIRVCLDTRALNSALIVNDKFQIPNIRTALEVFAGNKLFGEFDLSEAYLQFQLHPDSRPFTAFTWKGQQYMFIGCPYGIRPLPSYFQRIMSRIFYDLSFIIEYIDNLPFASRTWPEHQQHALTILQRLNQVNLRIKPSSVNLGHAQIKLLGHIVSALGIRIDPEKLQAIHDWPLPETGADLQSFLGFCTFLRAHVRHYAELTSLLESIKLQKHIEWTPELITDFEATKVALASAPILKFPDFNRPFHIATDASNTGVGGVLFQPNNDTEHITADNIVAIVSKKLQPHQQRWPAYKKELFGVVYSLRKFHSYVWGRSDLVVITDHKPLIYMFSSKELSPSLQQWYDVILDYNFTIIHRDGILNVLPDQLSRMFTSHYDKSIAWGASKEPFSDAKPLEEINVSIGFLMGEEEADSEIPSINENLHSDSEIDLLDLDSDPSIKLLIELEKRGKKSPSTPAEKLKLIKDAHAFGHFGREAIFKDLFNRDYWWPNMRTEIEIELQQCDACTRFVVTKRGFNPASFITSSGPSEHYQIDTSVHLPESADGYTALFVLIDVFTGFVILKPLKDTTAFTVARKLWKIFCTIGFPKILQSDNGSEFVNDILRSLIKITGIEHRLITPYNPRADGKVERSIGTVMMIIKKLLHGTNNNWPLYVSFAQITFNNKVNQLTGASPFALMFGRALNELKDYSQLNDNNEPTSISLDDWKQHMVKVQSVIFPATSDRIRSGKLKLMETLNKTRRQLSAKAFRTGDTVMLIDPVRNDKFEPKYIGPYEIKRRARNGGYVIFDATGDVLDRHVTADQMKFVSRSKRKIDIDNAIYEVNKIIEHRGEPSAYEYLVDWKGYSENERTWEPEHFFLDSSVIKKYWDLKRSQGQSG